MQSDWQHLLQCSNSYQKKLLDLFLTKGTINLWRKYAPRGSAARLIVSTLPELLISGPAGTGKSRACLEKLNYCANTYPGSRYLIARKTRTSLSDTGLVTFERDVLGLDHPMIMDGPQRAWRRAYIYDNGSEIVTGGLDKPGKVLSSEYDIIYVQQAEELNLYDWEVLTTRLRNNRLPFQQIVADCNPASPLHWLKRRCDDGATVYLDSDFTDNPMLWDAEADDWTPEGRRYLSKLDSLTGTRKLRLRHGLWAVPEGAIYEVFDEERHKVKSFPIPPLWPRVVGIDPVGAYIAAVWIAYDPRAKVLNVYREYLEPFGIPTSKHAENLLRLSGYDPSGTPQAGAETIFYWCGGGPSERQARLDFQANGIPIQAPGVADVWAGINQVIELLDDFRLVIHDCCVNLLSGIGDYRRKVKNGVPTDQIEGKERFHLPDALRYAILGPEEQEREEISYEPVKIGRWQG